MKVWKNFDWLAPAITAIGLLGFAIVFKIELGSFRNAVIEWASRDLKVRTELAASTLEEPLKTGDFAKIHAFGNHCNEDGMRLTVFSAPGGLVFDSKEYGSEAPAAIYETKDSGEFKVRLGLPLEKVLAPFRRARFSFILAALVGAAGVLLVFFVTYRQRVHIRELAKLEKFRREFIADVSHEIKTPLTGILCAVDMLGDGYNGQLVEMIGKESKRLNSLVQSILDLARMEREDTVLNKTDTDVGTLVRDIVEERQTQAKEKGITMTFRGEGSSVTANCDPQLISQAIDNLVGNAIRHSGSKDIIVSVENNAGEARITVEDHGIGIPPDDASRVFERFYRVDPARAATTGGAGLGLAIVQRIAHMHNGNVTLTPAAPSGCKFTLIIPHRQK